MTMIEDTRTLEHDVLIEIGTLCSRVRELRISDARGNETAIKALEIESRTKWDELRSLRAGPVNIDAPSGRGGGHYG